MTEIKSDPKVCEAKIRNNIWETNLDEVIATIKELSSEDSAWCWAYNWNCKYITLRFDMRDGAFIIQDDKGKRICLDALKWQRK